ncbi:hypothetical protein BHE74_00029225 [Ensete ventricosum]|nr:hypothetical protein BHE74_00029225 [Ensete ventricosum]
MNMKDYLMWLTSGLAARSLNRTLSMQKAVKNKTALLPHMGYLSSLWRNVIKKEVCLLPLVSSLTLIGQRKVIKNQACLISPLLVSLFVFVFSRPRLFLLLLWTSWLAEFDQEGSRMKLSFSLFSFLFLCLCQQAASTRMLPPPDPCPSAMVAMRLGPSKVGGLIHQE